jgi:hypothetical protein
MSELINTEEISAGSLWRRWEPHVHAPRTIFNNQFKGAVALEGSAHTCAPKDRSCERAGSARQCATGPFAVIDGHRGEFDLGGRLRVPPL